MLVCNATGQTACYSANSVYICIIINNFMNVMQMILQFVLLLTHPVCHVSAAKPNTIKIGNQLSWKQHRLWPTGPRWLTAVMVLIYCFRLSSTSDDDCLICEEMARLMTALPRAHWANVFKACCRRDLTRGAEELGALSAEKTKITPKCGIQQDQARYRSQ